MGPAVIVPDQFVEGDPLPFVHTLVGGLLDHVVEEHVRRATM